MGKYVNMYVIYELNDINHVSRSNVQGNNDNDAAWLHKLSQPSAKSAKKWTHYLQNYRMCWSLVMTVRLKTLKQQNGTYQWYAKPVHPYIMKKNWAKLGVEME